MPSSSAGGQSWILLGGQRYPRVRSYSMNFQIGDYLYWDSDATGSFD